MDAYIPHTHTHTPYTIPLDSWFISRDSTIQLVSLCVHRDVPTTRMGFLSVHRPSQGYTHNPTGLPVRSQGYTYTPMGIQRSLCLHRGFHTQDPIANPSWTHTHLSFPACPPICLSSSPLHFLYSVSDRFCHLPRNHHHLMGPVPSLIHNVSLRLGLVISASQIIILPTRLNPLTPATQSVHFSLPDSPWTWHLFFGQFPMTLSSNITSSPSLYWSCTEVCSRNAHSCHSVVSLKSLNPNLS